MKLEWRKSSRSGGATDEACVEIAMVSDANPARAQASYR